MTSSPQGKEQRKTHHAVFLVILLAIVLAVIAAFLFWPAPTPISDRPLDLPVEQPELDSMQDIADAMEGKPLPAEVAGLTLPPINKGDHIQGNQSAAFSIVEYSDFGNTYATLLHSELKKLVTSDSSVNWIYRYFLIGATDFLPSQAAECAYFQKADHAAFWAYFDQSFALKNATQEQLVSLATQQGLDTAVFQDCLSNNFTRDHVIVDMQDGRLDAKVSVSPSYVVVNNITGKLRLVEGVNTIEYLKEVVDALR